MSDNIAQCDIHSLVRCKKLQELLDTARENLRSPLILADLSFHVLAITEEENVTDPRWVQIFEQRLMTPDIVNVAAYQSALHSGEPAITVDATDLTIIRCAVEQENRIIGYLLSPCYGGPPTQQELDTIVLLTDLCSLRMQKDLHYAEYPEDMLAFFISDLLNGTITDEQTIHDRCRFFRWNLKTPYRVLSIQTESKDEKRIGADYLELEGHLKAIKQAIPDATAFLYGDQIKLVLQVYDQNTRDAIELEHVSELLKSRGLVAGVSQTAYRLRNIAGRHQQTLKALQMGILLNGTGPLYLYDNYSIYHCLEICAPQVNLTQLCHSAVLKLEAYDRKNGTELMSTLHAYLSCHTNMSEAAASLYIHRNTLAKRLEKINDLMHVDFSDAETTFHLMFSFRILEYYGAAFMRDSYDNWMERSPILRHP